MKIFPAIDIRGGQAVRLTQGDYDQMVVYSDDPVQVAKDFASQGARHLHIVDLDGAKEGALMNFGVIEKILAQGDFFVQVGGGIRDRDRVAKYLDLGVDRLILGTIATQDPQLVVDLVGQYGGKIAVGVDAREGFVATHGWQETTDIPALDFCKKLEAIGVQTIIYTDIGKDGKLEGTNLDIYKSLGDLKMDLVASGGISFEEEVLELKAQGIYGAIVGKALYAGKLDLAQIIQIAKRSEEV